jgi:hypothetical protein
MMSPDSLAMVTFKLQLDSTFTGDEKIQIYNVATCIRLVGVLVS